MEKLINCKVCGNEMAKSAKSCPSCGAKNKKPFYKKWWLWGILIVIVIVAAGTGNSNNSSVENNIETPVVEKNSPKISKEEFEQLKPGITYEEAVSIIGGEGELMSEVDLGGYNTKMYMWEGEGIIGANANASFQNNTLKTKAQVGLE